MPSEHMKELIRESVKALEVKGAGALVPIKDASPHFVSRTNDHKENGLMFLFPAVIDDETYYVYIKQ